MNHQKSLFIHNAAFEKAITLLAHPYSVIALIILLVNDHVLRMYWPSWVTGKLGDVAWLFFAPFLAAAVLAWLIPNQIKHRDGLVFSLGFGLTGLVYCIVKVVPFANDLATRIIQFFFQNRFVFTLDPGDLIALPALLAAFLLWLSHKNEIHFSPRGWVVLPVAVLLTLANSGIPDSGIYCLSSHDDTLIAYNGYTKYTSRDTLTWDVAAMGEPPGCQRQFAENNDWIEVSGPNAGSRYRFQMGGNIELFDGSIWQSVYQTSNITEARRFYYIKSHQGYAVYTAGPLDAIADPKTGSMLFAMGHQGILLHTRSGEWQWITVGPYHRLDPFPTADAFGLVLGGMFMLAGILILLFYTTFALHWAGGPLRIVLVCIAWGIWLGVDVLFPPAQSVGYNEVISSFGMLVALLVAIPLAVEQTVRIFQRAAKISRAMTITLSISLLGAVLYMLPYILWLFSTLPQLLWATFFSIGISAAILAAGIVTLRREPVVMLAKQHTSKGSTNTHDKDDS